MKKQQNPPINAAVPVVFFGKSGAGKSTLIGYILATCRDDIDVDKINKKVLLNAPKDYRSSYYYAYIVDKNAEEWARGEQKQNLGTSKKMHISRIENSIIINDNSITNDNSFQVDLVLLDTPGSPTYYRDRFRGLTFGEIGVFLFEITSAAKWLDTNNTLKNDNKVLEEMIHGLIPLNTWLKLPSKPKTIIVLSKGDNTDIPLEQVVCRWKNYANQYCGNEIYDLPIIPIEILVKEKKSINIFENTDDKRYLNTKGVLWDIIKTEANHTVKISIDQIENSLPVFAVEKIFKNIPGTGNILQGKVVSGSFSIDKSVRIIPALNEYRDSLEFGVTGTIKSIKKADGSEAKLVMKGDIVGFSFGKTSINKFKIRRGTLVISKDSSYLHGNCLELEIDMQDHIKKLKLFEECSVVWFGSIMQVQIIALKDKRIVVESRAKGKTMFVMPIKINADMFTHDIVILLTDNPIPIKAKLLRVGEILNIEISEAHIENVGYEQGVRWFDTIKQKEKIVDLNNIEIHPSSVNWKEVK